jgi:predicted HicB family RNase H-like nuclease
MKKGLLIYVTKDLHTKIKVYAAQKGMSISTLVKQALEKSYDIK